MDKCIQCGGCFKHGTKSRLYCSKKCLQIYHSSLRAKSINEIILDGEEWSPVNGYNGRYEVSNLGRVKSITHKIKNSMNIYQTKRGRILSPMKGNRGYMNVSLYDNSSKYKKIQVHRLVATEFICNPENKPCVNHIDGVKTNNNVSNLEWVTTIENIHHAYRTGLMQKGNNYMHELKNKESFLTKKVICNKTGRIFISVRSAAN